MNNTEEEPLAWFTAGDLHTLIEVLNTLEASYTQDILEEVNESDAQSLIDWSKQMRRKIDIVLKSVGLPHDYRFGISTQTKKD